MSKAVIHKKNIIIFSIPILIILIIVFIAKSNVFIANPNNLSLGITFDLLLTVPLVYFLLIRKTNIPKTTVVPFFVVGIIICSLTLPTKNQFYLNLFKTWGLPIVELIILSFVIFNVKKGLREYKLNKTESFDFFTTLKITCYKLLPKGAVIPIVTEIAVFYYGFVYWKRRKLKDNEFTYHKDSGAVTLLIALIFIVVIETITLHTLLFKWNTSVAWILTFLSAYSCVQIFGFLKSLSKRPISIENNKLYLRYGIIKETTIDLSNIDSIEISSKDLELNKETRKLSFLGELESHNIVIRLKEENTLFGLYGINRKYKNLMIHVDNKIEFRDRINNALNKFH